jgi:hypothetical protein
MLLVLIGETTQKVAELAADKCDDLWLLDPCRQILLIISIVVVVAYIFLQVIFHLSLAH